MISAQTVHSEQPCEPRCPRPRSCPQIPNSLTRPVHFGVKREVPLGREQPQGARGTRDPAVWRYAIRHRPKPGDGILWIMLFLIDSNIAIASEPLGVSLEAGAQSAIEFLELASRHHHDVRTHPASLHDFARITDPGMRAARLLLFRRYTLPNCWKTSASRRSPRGRHLER